MASQARKREADENVKEVVCGYIHNVTECRISLYKSTIIKCGHSDQSQRISKHGHFHGQKKKVL